MPARQTLALLVVASFLPAAAQAQTTLYRWVDKDGKVHYTDAPPPQEAKGVVQKRMGGGADASSLPYATQVAMQKSPVVLYWGAACGEPCSKGRDLLARRGVPFTERDAQGNAEHAEALQKLIGSMEVPVLTLGANKVKGYDEGAWNAALDAAGYPRTVLPGQRPPAPAPRPEAAPPAK